MRNDTRRGEDGVRMTWFQKQGGLLGRTDCNRVYRRLPHTKQKLVAGEQRQTRWGLLIDPMKISND
jgi:hypothetical protein